MHATRQTGYWAVIALLLVGFCGACGFMLAELRKDNWIEAVDSSGNLLTVLSQDLSSSLLAYDRVLAGLARQAGEAGSPPPGQEGALDLTFDGLSVEPYAGSVLIFAEEGTFVRELRRGDDLAANSAFQGFVEAQLASPRPDLVVSAPFAEGPLNQNASIALAHAVFGPDGTLQGLAVGTLKLAYFQNLFSQARLRPSDSIDLFNRAGMLLMRGPLTDNEIGRDLSATANVQRFLSARSGMFRATAAVDGVERLYHFSRVGELPLILNVALATDNIFAAWRRQAVAVSVLLAILCAVAIALGLAIRREFQRRWAAEAATRRSEAQYRLLADHATDLIVHLDESLVRLYVSPASQSMLGYEPGEMAGRQTREIVHPHDWPLVEEIADRARSTDETADAAYRLRHRDGHYVWVEGRYSHLKQTGGFIAVLRDITLRKEAESRLEAAHAELSQLANTDGLTGLANRRRFDTALNQALADADRDQTPVSLLLIDVDRFKLFNDTYGHLAGDECLRKVSRAIESDLRPDDLCARYGGEEIAVLLPGVGAQAAERIGERARLAVMALDIAHTGQSPEGRLTISIGCATLAPSSAPASGPALVEQADRFLYEAKRTGRNRLVSGRNLPFAPQPAPQGDEHARLSAVRTVLERADSKGPASFDLIARHAALLLGMPLGFVSLVGKDDLRFIGRYGNQMSGVPRDISFCNHAITGSEPLVVCDTLEDERFRHNPLVRGETGLRFYAGAPVVDPASEQTVGTVCVFDTDPHRDFGETQREVLKTLSAMAAKEFD